MVIDLKVTVEGCLHLICVVYYFRIKSSLVTLLGFGSAMLWSSSATKNIHTGPPTLSSASDANTLATPVLFGLEYAHAIQSIKDKVVEVCESSKLEIQFVELLCSTMNPLENQNNFNQGMVPPSVLSDNKSLVASNRYSIGVKYDATTNCMVTDLSQQKRIVKQSTTLGVAGYLNMINQMKELISTAGKKAYTLVMGKPNPAKLANFPEDAVAFASSSFFLRIIFSCVNDNNNYFACMGGTDQVRFQPCLGRYITAAAENIVSMLDVATQDFVKTLQNTFHHNFQMRSNGIFLVVLFDQYSQFQFNPDPNSYTGMGPE
ncbi:hypothetical protein UlMin_036760 [Ulmus minor]